MPDHLPSRIDQIAHFKHLTEVTLPALAREHRWPIRLDHCFKRICLDAALRRRLRTTHLPRPAERHLEGEPLARAVLCAESIAAEGLPTLTLRNAESLHFRGKRSPHLIAGNSLRWRNTTTPIGLS